MTSTKTRFDEFPGRYTWSWMHRLGEDNRLAMGVLLAIILCGAVLRLANLSQQGFLHWDEANLMLEARFWLNGIHNLDALVTGRAEGAPPFTGKLNHGVFIALATSLFGDTPFAGDLVSALFGLLTLPIVYLIGLVLSGGDRKTGLLSAAFLAFSPYHLMYSRMALAEADATCFFQAGLLIWILTRGKNTHIRIGLFATGVLLSAAATTNYRYWPVVIVSAIILGFAALQGSNWKINRQVISGLGLLFIGIGLTPAMWQIVFKLLGVYALDRHISMSLSDYMAQLNSLTFGNQLNLFPPDLPGFLRVMDIGFYVKAFFMFGGIVFTLLIFGSFFWTLISLGGHLIHRNPNISTNLGRSNEEYIYVALGFAMPFLFFTFYPFKALRFISVVLPTCSFLAAVILTRVMSFRTARHLVWVSVGFLILATLLESAVKDSKILSWRSGYQEAMEYLRNQNVTRVVTTQLPITQYYDVNPSHVRWVPGSEAKLYDDFQDGYEYFLVDDHGYYSDFNAKLIRKIEAQLSPAFVTPDPFKAESAFYLEQDPARKSFDEALASFKELGNERYAHQIRIYKLDSDFVASLPGPEAFPKSLGSELLRNPGFEDSTSGAPTTWSPYGQPIFDQTGQKAHSGEAAVCTSRDGRSSGYFQAVPITPGTMYRLSEYVRSSSNLDESARVQINWVDAQGSIVGVSLEVVPALPDAWSQRSIVANAPPGSSRAIIYVSVHLAAQVCFDDFSFDQIGP